MAAKRIYIFDWDDNVCCLPTRVHMLKGGEPFACPTRDFAAALAASHQLAPEAFRDFGCPARFTEHMGAAQRGPAFAKFMEAADAGHPTAVVTARSLSAAQMKDAIAASLLHPDRHGAFFERLRVFPVSAEGFAEAHGLPGEASTGTRKQAAVDRFLREQAEAAAPGERWTVGFSDDDAGNLAALRAFFQAPATREAFPLASFVLYDTTRGVKERL